MGARRPVTIGMAAALMVGSLLGATPAVAATQKLEITRVYVNAPRTDTHSNNSVNGEYVKIRDKGSKAVAMKGYTLRDQQRHVYTFSAFTLGAGKTVTVYTGKGSDTSSKRYMRRGWHIWNNDGHDSATLRNAGGAKIDSCGWGTTSSYKNC